jgi:hypothetical protein
LQTCRSPHNDLSIERQRGLDDKMIENETELLKIEKQIEAKEPRNQLEVRNISISWGLQIWSPL